MEGFSYSNGILGGYIEWGMGKYPIGCQFRLRRQCNIVFDDFDLGFRCFLASELVLTQYNSGTNATVTIFNVENTQILVPSGKSPQTVEQGFLVEVLLGEDGRDELLKRLKKEQEKENMRIQRLTGKHPQIFSDGSNSRRLNSVQTITEIRPYLLLCGALALRGNVLQDLEVTCVINATNELPDTPLPQSVKSDILYLRVSVDDKSDSDILSWLDMVSDLIHEVKLASGKTLIHCVAGISRSATLCLAYLIKYEGCTLYDSYNTIRQLRYIRPNSGFFGQLVEFEKRVTGKQTVLMIPNRYASTCIPHLYEDDYNKLYTYKYKKL